ncbi:MAG: uracil phosphoribosyltransferase [Bacteroidales bacterium]|jgi:uracil phosphoribosyltransferase|nr:uracil phosphoribosyltransferase [Bacteroidales bacterium]
MIHILDIHNSIANDFLSELRDIEIQKDRMRFRKNLERMGEIFAYEISKTMEYEEKEIVSSLGIAKCSVLKHQPVLCPIMRAGLAFHQGFLNYFDKAESAFISTYRKHEKDGSFEIELDYMSSPNLEDKTLILLDSMIATGFSITSSLKGLRPNYGEPAKIHVVSVISSIMGIDYLKKNLPIGTHIWTTAIDQELTAQAYIVPGLGDAGDLAYGEK